MTNKVSNILKQNRIINSKSFNSLTPVMKEAVKDVFIILKKEQKDIIKNFEGAVDKVAHCHKVNKEFLYNYFNKEVNEQLGVK